MDDVNTTFSMGVAAPSIQMKPEAESAGMFTFTNEERDRQPLSDVEGEDDAMGNGLMANCPEGDPAANSAALMYGIEDRPPVLLLLMLSLQNVLTEFGSLFAYPYMIGTSMCIQSDGVGFSELLGTIIFVAGLTTLVQSTVGSRLPLVQGSSFSFIMPVLFLMRENEHLCPDFYNPGNTTLPFEQGSAEHKALWKSNLNKVNGSLMMASLFQTLVGFTGLIGYMTKFIGPLTVASNMSLIGLAFFNAASEKGSTHWGISILTVLLVVVFSQYMKDIHVPCIGGRRLPLFSLFPILMAVVISWLVCLILTVADALPDRSGEAGYLARTDVRTSAIEDTLWFRFPYPGYWGTPTMSLGGVLGMMAAMTASIIESVGDYYACAIICQVPPPPKSAVSRGIAFEGFNCFLAGAFGSAGGTTSYGTNMATISLTRVGSRSVIHCAGVIMLILGCLGKFTGLIATIPEPIVGGLLFILLGMCLAVGLSNLQTVALMSTRNMFVVGFSVIFGLGIGEWVMKNPFRVGHDTVDQILNVLCGTSVFLGSVISLILDNTLPGTREERGFLPSSQSYQRKENGRSAYDLPLTFLNEWRFFRFFPICPRWDSKSKLDKYDSTQKV